MLTNQRQTKRLREEIVVANESDFKLKPRMIDHLRVSKLACSTKLLGERDSGRGAEYVEDGSVAMRSGAVQHSRDRLEFGFGFGPKETDHAMNLGESETGGLPNRPSKDKNLFNKKTLQNSSELALFRRSPTAYFGLANSQETESYAAQAVDSHLEAGAREAQATRERKRKLNPFLREEVDDREASATRENSRKGVMPLERQRELPLAKPLSLEQFVALMTSPLGVSPGPYFKQTNSYSTNTSSNSDSGKLHATLHGRLIPSAVLHPTSVHSLVGRCPINRGKTFF